jgi:hypothetical protein
MNKLTMSQPGNIRENLDPALAKAEIGRKYLKAALASRNEQAFLLALHKVIDAICWDINHTEN